MDRWSFVSFQIAEDERILSLDTALRNQEIGRTGLKHVQQS